MRRSLASLFLSLLVAASLGASTLPQLLQKAKEQFRLGAYVQALETLGAPEQESLKEGHEKDRVKLTPVLAFYRGVSNASLGEARRRVSSSRYSSLFSRTSSSTRPFTRRRSWPPWKRRGGRFARAGRSRLRPVVPRSSRHTTHSSAPPWSPKRLSARSGPKARSAFC